MAEPFALEQAGGKVVRFTVTSARLRRSLAACNARTVPCPCPVSPSSAPWYRGGSADLVQDAAGLTLTDDLFEMVGAWISWR
jgi:hypothetical protein